MADQKLTAVYVSNPVTLDPGDLLYTVENTGTTPASGAFKSSQLMTNRYKITPTVVSNDLVLAIKHLDGTDPSADRPLYFKIGDTFRAVTGALSVTKADATNWFGSGGAAFATKEVDYFVYVGYNATDGVTVGFSRIPYANLYSDFSATTTNEKYCAISTITTAAAGDNYVNIGRFAATLSAGAGYTWTVPTFTTANLVQFPIFETRWLTYVPAVASSAGSITTVGAVSASYKIINAMFFNDVSVAITNNGTGSGVLTVTVPFTIAGNAAVAYGANVSTGKLLGAIPTAASTFGFALYDYTYPVATGQTIRALFPCRLV
jgi:hypothetical protein